MGDRTLIEQDIERFVREFRLIEPFSAHQLRQCFYDFRVGERIIHAHPDGYLHAQLLAGKDFELRPGDICTVFSLERVDMPLNVKGRLSLRGRLANQQLFFSGGPVDPGYRGYLFFTLINLGSAGVKIKYGEGIVTAEFILLEPPVRLGYSDQIFLEIPQFRLPPLPARKLYDWMDLSQKNDSLESRYEDVRHDVRVSRTLTINFFYAASAGIIAGIVGALVTLLFQTVLKGLIGG